MRKKSLRFISAALAVSMMLSVLPVGAFAAEPGAAEPENGVSAQALEGTPLKVGQTVNKGGTYLLDGDYTGKYGITIDTSEDVTINIGKVTCAISGGDWYNWSSRGLLYVKNVGTLIINGEGGSVEGTANSFLTTSDGANMKVHVNGGTYTIGPDGFSTTVFNFFASSGQYRGKDAYLSGVTAKGGYVVDVDGWHVQIDGGSYIGTQDYLEDDEDYGVLRAWGDESVLTVNNAEVSSKYDHVTCLACYGGNAVLTGGTYTSAIVNDTNCKMTLNNVNVPSKYRALYNGGEMTINGGSYSGNRTSALYATGGGETYIHGGTFTSKNMEPQTDEAVIMLRTTFISGAIVDPDSSLVIDEDYSKTTIENEDGDYAIYAGSLLLTLKSGTVIAHKGDAIRAASTTVQIDGGTITAMEGNAIQRTYGTLQINNGELNAPKGNAIIDKDVGYTSTGGHIEINGGQAEGGLYGLYEEKQKYYQYHQSSDEAIINGGTISGSKADIYLGEKQCVRIAGNYPDELTVEVQDPYHKRQITEPYQDDPANGVDNVQLKILNPGYGVGTAQQKYSDSDSESFYRNYRYLIAQHTVNPVNAEAKVGEQEVTSTDLVDADTTVTVTATVPEGQRFTGWTVKVGDEEKEADTFLTTPDKNDPTKVTFTMPDADVEVTANFKGIPTLNIGDHVTANIKDSDAPVPSGSAVLENTTVHLTATAPEGQHFISWTVLVGGEEKEADTFLTTPDKNDPTKATFTMPDKNVEVKANFEGDPTLNIGDHVTANMDGSDAPVPSGSAVPENTTVHLTATVPEGQHFTGWTVKVGGEEKEADTFLTTPDKNDPTKVTFTMPKDDVFVTAEYDEDTTVDPGTSDSDYGGDIAAGVVIGGIAAVGAYEVGTGLYRILAMDDVAMPTNRIALAKLLWERAGKPEPESTALYSDISAEDTDAQKAARWAVEQELLNDAEDGKFHPAFPVSKLRVCLTWEKAKQKGLFDKTEA